MKKIILVLTLALAWIALASSSTSPDRSTTSREWRWGFYSISTKSFSSTKTFTNPTGEKKTKNEKHKPTDKEGETTFEFISNSNGRIDEIKLPGDYYLKKWEGSVVIAKKSGEPIHAYVILDLEKKNLKITVPSQVTKSSDFKAKAYLKALEKCIPGLASLDFLSRPKIATSACC